MTEDDKDNIIDGIIIFMAFVVLPLAIAYERWLP